MRLVRRVMARTRRQSRWVRRFLFVINRELKNEQRKPHIFLKLDHPQNLICAMKALFVSVFVWHMFHNHIIKSCHYLQSERQKLI